MLKPFADAWASLAISLKTRVPSASRTRSTRGWWRELWNSPSRRGSSRPRRRLRRLRRFVRRGRAAQGRLGRLTRRRLRGPARDEARRARRRPRLGAAPCGAASLFVCGGAAMAWIRVTGTPAARRRDVDTRDDARRAQVVCLPRAAAARAQQRAATGSARRGRRYEQGPPSARDAHAATPTRFRATRRRRRSRSRTSAPTRKNARMAGRPRLAAVFARRSRSRCRRAPRRKATWNSAAAAACFMLCRVFAEGTRL